MSGVTSLQFSVHFLRRAERPTSGRRGPAQKRQALGSGTSARPGPDGAPLVASGRDAGALGLLLAFLPGRLLGELSLRVRRARLSKRSRCLLRPGRTTAYTAPRAERRTAAPRPAARAGCAGGSVSARQCRRRFSGRLTLATRDLTRAAPGAAAAAPCRVPSEARLSAASRATGALQALIVGR